MLGYMRAIEVTYNQQEDTYHPHIHCIFAVKAGYFKGNGYIKIRVAIYLGRVLQDWIWADCSRTDN